MSDVIDVSEWLHASFHKVYPSASSRIRQENNKYYTRVPANIFDDLYNRGKINAAALSAAEFLFTLNEVATQKTGYSKMVGLFNERGHASVANRIPGFCPMTLMLLISRNMAKWQYEVVKRICFHPVHEKDLAWIDYLSAGICESFDELGKSIEISIDIMKNRLDTTR